MSVSNGLRKLAQQLQENADVVLEEAEKSKPLFSLVADVVANAVVHLEKAAAAIEDREPVVTGELLDTIAYLATALDETGDAVLQKKASLLDELLVTISAPKSAVAQARRQSEEELARLREKYRDQNREEIYKTRTRDAFDKMNQTEKTRGLVADQVKTYRVLQAPLQTRYCPDHPGVGMIRIADRVFQCALDHKVYDYKQGYTTMKGNKVPGSGVENQVPDWGQYDGATVFDTRETLMSRYARADQPMSKFAEHDSRDPDAQHWKNQRESLFDHVLALAKDEHWNSEKDVDDFLNELYRNMTKDVGPSNFFLEHVLLPVKHRLMETMKKASAERRFSKSAQKDYEYGMVTGPDGRKYIQVRASANMSEERKRQVAKEIQATMGSLYPIRFAVQ